MSSLYITSKTDRVSKICRLGHSVFADFKWITSFVRIDYGNNLWKHD